MSLPDSTDIPQLYESYSQRVRLLCDNVLARITADAPWPATNVDHRIAAAILDQIHGIMAQLAESQKILLQATGRESLDALFLMTGITTEQRNQIDEHKDAIMAAHGLLCRAFDQEIQGTEEPSFSPRLPQADLLFNISRNFQTRALLLQTEYEQLRNLLPKNPTIAEGLRLEMNGLKTEFAFTEIAWFESMRRNLNVRRSMPELPETGAILRLLRSPQYGPRSAAVYLSAKKMVQEMYNRNLEPVVRAARHGRRQ
jgi:hypothetical protein